MSTDRAATPPSLTSRRTLPPETVRKKDVNRRRMARLGWYFSTPALLVVAAVTIFPVVFSLVMSFSNVQVLGSGFQLSGLTLGNFHTVFGSVKWRYALGFTVLYTVVTVTVEVVLGTMIALVLEHLRALRGWMMALLLIPWSLITVISAQLWNYIYDPTYGAADAIFSAVGLGHPVILGSNASAVIAMMVADIWKTTPFVAIIVLAGLVMLPGDVYEAAEVDGSNGWQTFWRITLPLLRPTIALAVLFRILQAFGLFDLPFVLTQGGPGYATTSLAVLGYQAMFTNLSFGPGAAVAVTTAALVVIGCILFLRVFRAQVNEGEGS
ncbi:carbohydrate ABC transporter permease [Arthrobacter sp. STN4]|uniref:carbohydrate ABC transporter permease n=1 Tax=Arthrobacter sp. STN4 TaxID=2923276 RepID=UPI00211A40B7|nr:sugar ABC transporter permease [Arthrobacter sp. STN4]MCQ9165063.1 sugar ABC transporter permease [Arthrobacter sp. STN4]